MRGLSSKSEAKGEKKERRRRKGESDRSFIATFHVNEGEMRGGPAVVSIETFVSHWFT